MTASDLLVAVIDDEIIVAATGTGHAVTYYKPAKSPQLSLSESPIETIRA